MSDPPHTPPPQSAPPPPLPKEEGSCTGCTIGLVIALVALVLFAMLAAIAVPLGKNVLDKGRVVQDNVAMRSLEMAVKGYETEYKTLPNLDTSDETKFVVPRGLLLDILWGKNAAQNPHLIAFFDVPPPFTEGAGGGIVTPGGVELRDHFGTPYRMHFDWNRDGYIPNPEHSGAIVPGLVIIYAAGPDRDYTTWGDNVKSWGRRMH
jgi:type II secretory pathway pseudopilin PulG